MISTSWIVQSKTEAGEGKIAVNLRRRSAADGSPAANGGSVSIVLDQADARDYEPGTRVSVTIEVDVAAANA